MNNQQFQRQWFEAKNLFAWKQEKAIFENALKDKDFNLARLVLRTKNIRKNTTIKNRLEVRLERALRNEYRTEKTIRICFQGMWQSFSENNNPLISLFEHVLANLNSNYKIICVSIDNDPDIIICGCYTQSQYPVNNGAILIYYLPEPVYPSFDDADYCISQFNGHCNNNNIYLPLYLFELNEQFVKYQYPDRQEQPTDKKDLQGYIVKDEDIPKRDFCIIASNSHPIRLDIISLIESHGFKVDKYGSAFARRIESKDELIGKYKFVICPENSYLSGYISEKIIHARRLGAVPVYYGYATDSIYFNNNAFISYSPDKHCFTEALSLKGELSSLYKKYISKDLLAKSFNYKDLYDKITNILIQLV